MKGRYYKETDLEARATPKSPIKGILALCPCCNYHLCWDDEEIQENFCPACGQAITWDKWEVE